MKQYMKRTVGRVARFAAREFADELHRTGALVPAASAPPSGPDLVRIDVEHALQQLSSGVSRTRLNHFYTWNHRWIALLAERNRRAAMATYDFADNDMATAVFRMDQFELVESRRDEIVELDGAILDLGVYKGASTRALARIFADRQVHGFDSFEGLPGDWSHVLKGDFGDVAGRLPEVPDNATLHKGWFDDTLPVWVAQHGSGPISLLRVDCDIYSSTKTIFDVLGPQVRSGTWVLFDEMIGYRGWEQHEYKAFIEFLAERPELAPEYVAYGLTYVLVRLVRNEA